ncbi:MAG TPA: AAA family ATPase [Pirellulales bacterium]|nr:AAA family ATPase [Pirellulales bacterium]
MKKPPLRYFRVENFKAIRESGRVEFGWLTALIGNNGSGKSSLVEALETFRDIVKDGVEPAFRRWRGFEHVLNKSRERKFAERASHRPAFDAPLRFCFDWNLRTHLTGQQSITQGPIGDTLFIQQEQMIERRKGRTERWTRNDRGEVTFATAAEAGPCADAVPLPELAGGESILKRFAPELFDRWQFLMLNPERMGQPVSSRMEGAVTLARDGANIAEYLDDFLVKDPDGFEDMLDAIRHVLPYASNLQPARTSEPQRASYLKLGENGFDIPGWSISRGTLRIVALLACLRHPSPPALLVVEEVENGLDPRTLNMLVEEIRAAITLGTTQVILTTHSPYLLDLLALEHIVVVERIDGEPVFTRPNKEELASWAESFSPGRLYTMGRLTRNDR